MKSTLVGVEYRSLKEEELDQWFDHCATVFTKTPREYFVRHWEHDPTRDIGGIKVAIYNGSIISTVRVFLRKAYLNGESVLVGGIGEVSTRPEYRRQGLASKLLQAAIQFMQEKGVIISMLHTGSAAPLYASKGWKSTDFAFRIRKWHPFSHPPEQQTNTFRTLNFEGEDMRKMQQLYPEYNHHFSGVWTREEPGYWERWLRAEWEVGDWKTKGSKKGITLVMESENNRWIGYIICFINETLPKEERVLEIREFVTTNEEFEKDGGRQVFGELLNAVGQRLEGNTLEGITLKYPLTIEERFAGEASNEGEIVEDKGMMYRWMKEGGEEQGAIQGRILFWALDSF